MCLGREVPTGISSPPLRAADHFMWVRVALGCGGCISFHPMLTSSRKQSKGDEWFCLNSWCWLPRRQLVTEEKSSERQKGVARIRSKERLKKQNQREKHLGKDLAQEWCRVSMGWIKSRIEVFLGIVWLWVGCKGTVCILALQILIIFKLVPEVCHIHQFGIAASFLSTVCPDDYCKSAVRNMKVMLVSDIQTPRKGERNVGLLCDNFDQSHQKKKKKSFVLAHKLNTCCIVVKTQHQFPLVGNVLHTGFGNIISPHGKNTVRQPSITFQMVTPSCYCIALPGCCKECLTMWSYPNLTRLGSGIFVAVCMTSFSKED